MFTPKNKMPKAVHDVEQLANEIHKAVKPKLKVKDVWFGKEAFHGPQSHSSRTTTFKGGDSEACRSAFRTDVDHDSEVMPISVPN